MTTKRKSGQVDPESDPDALDDAFDDVPSDVDVDVDPEELEALGATPPSTDAIYESLGNTRRRYAIHFLKQHGGESTVGELATQIAAWENDKPVSEITSKERKRVYIALYQSHLKSMAEAGLVEYDADRGTVRLTDSLAELDVYLELVPEYDIPWNLFYIGLSVANALLLGLVWAEVPPFSSLSPIAAGVVVLVTFSASAFAQTYSTTRMKLGDPGAPPGSSKADAD